MQPQAITESSQVSGIRSIKGKILHSIFLVCVLILLPLFPKPGLIFTWPILVTAVAGVVLNLTYPNLSNEHFFTTDPWDGWSFAAIIAAGGLAFLIPVLDYAYGREVRPTIDSLWTWVAFAALLGGFFLRYWGIRTIGHYFTSHVVIQENHQVIDEGPYKILRHPSYTGAFLMVFSISLLLRSYIGIVYCLVAFLGSYVYRIALEERALLAGIGEEYSRYQKRTWRMIPFVY